MESRRIQRITLSCSFPIFLLFLPSWKAHFIVGGKWIYRGGKGDTDMASFPGMNRLDSFTVSVLDLVKDSI